MRSRAIQKQIQKKQTNIVCVEKEERKEKPISMRSINTAGAPPALLVAPNPCTHSAFGKWGWQPLTSSVLASALPLNNKRIEGRIFCHPAATNASRMTRTLTESSARGHFDGAPFCAEDHRRRIEDIQQQLRSFAVYCSSGDVNTFPAERLLIYGGTLFCLTGARRIRKLILHSAGFVRQRKKRLPSAGVQKKSI